jgi:AcrR family transcriptional regulator
MIEIAGEEGYDAVTVRRLAKLAGVSTRTFYEHFEGKEECFLRTYELVVERTAARVVSAQAGEPDWRERIELAFEAFAGEIANKPRAARLALVEVFAAGPAALDAMDRAEELFEGMIGDSFARAPSAVEVPPPLVRAIVAGATFVARKRMTSAGQSQAPELARELLEWMLSFDVECVAEFGHPDRHFAGATKSVESNLDIARRSPADGGQEDRAMIMAAVVKLAAADGYWQLSIPRILAAAGLRKRSFTTHFDGVEDCFLAALEQWTTCALERAVASTEPGSSWADGVHRAIQGLCAQIAADPSMAKLIIVEPRAAGPNGITRQGEVLSKLAAELLHEIPRDVGSTSAIGAEASVGAIWSFLFHYVAADRAQQLPCLAPTLSFLALAPIIGGQAAADSIHRAGSDATRPAVLST